MTQTNWLNAIQSLIIKESSEDALKRVPLKKLSELPFISTLVAKTEDPALKQWLLNGAPLPKHRQAASRAIFPTSDEEAVAFKNEFGKYVDAADVRWLKTLYGIYNDLVSQFPQYTKEWTRLLTCKPIAAEPFDNPSVSYKIVRQELNLAIESESSEEFTLFLDTIFSDFKFKVEPTFIKKEGSPGYSIFVDIAGKAVSSRQLFNKTDKYGVFKKAAIEQMITNLDDVVSLLSRGEFKDLLEKHNILCLSRLVERLQEDIRGKVRHVRGADAVISKSNKLSVLDYKTILQNSLPALKQLPSEQAQEFQACRRRLAYAAELLIASIGNLLLPQVRLHMKNKYSFVFKFGSDAYLCELVKKSIESINSPWIATLDVTQFDHSVDYCHLLTLHKYLESKNELLGLTLQIQAISPILIGDLGYSQRYHKRLRNMALGDPYDPMTWFFGQGKSGDADVADRCKLICSWTMTTMILELLGLEYNKENIDKCLRGELAIKFCTI